MLEVKVRGTWLPDILSTLTGDSLGPSELVVNKQEVEYESTQYEQYTVEILPGWLTDDRGQHQKNGDENHQDRDDDGDLQAERQHVSRTALVPSETEKPHVWTELSAFARLFTPSNAGLSLLESKKADASSELQRKCASLAD